MDDVGNREIIILVKGDIARASQFNGYELRLRNLVNEDVDNQLVFLSIQEAISHLGRRKAQVVLEGAGLSFGSYVGLCLRLRRRIRRVFLQDSFLRYAWTRAKFMMRWRPLQAFRPRYLWHLVRGVVDQLGFLCFVDRIGFVSDEDYLLRAVSKSPAAVVRNGVVPSVSNEQPWRSKSPLFSDGLRLFFWGALDYEPNVHSLEYFFETYWSDIRRFHPRAEFKVYGARGDAIWKSKIERRFEGVRVLGEFEGLGGLARENDIFVNLVEYGAGMKNKTLEALVNEIPMITTRHAIEGISELANYPAIYGDIESLHRALDEIVRPDAVGERAHLRAKILEVYTWKNCFRAYMEFAV